MGPQASLEELLVLHAHRMAWRTQDGDYSYQDLAERIARVRCQLAELEAEAGSIWVLHGLKPFDAFTLLLAGMQSGLRMVQLPERQPWPVLQQLLHQVPWQGLIVAEELIHDETRQITWVDLRSLQGKKPVPIAYDSYRSSFGIFSSGSTGIPKAFMHSWNSLRSAAQASIDYYQGLPGDSWLLSLDLAHIGGLQIAMRSLLAGGCCVHLAEPKNLSLALASFIPDFVSLVPSQLYRLLADNAAILILSQAKVLILGGAAAAPDLVDQALGKGLRISVSYGSTETAALLAATLPGQRPQAADDAGEVLPHWEILSHGEQLWIKGPAATQGFYQDGILHECLNADGWLLLPDRIVCEGRRLKVMGRWDQVFQVAGENVSAAEILLALETFRHLAEFIILPIEDKNYGHVPVLIIRSMQEPDILPILNLLQTRLSGIKRPVQVFWHASAEVNKISQSYYIEALKQGKLALLWKK